MNDTSRFSLDDEISAVFKNGEILKAKEEKLQEYLLHLCSEHIPNDMVRHRAIIRSLTINHIQMQRHIDDLNKKNNRTQILVILLAIASLISSIVQVYMDVTKTTPM